MANASLWLVRIGLILAIVGTLAIALDIYASGVKRLLRSHCEAVEQDPGFRASGLIPLSLAWLLEILALVFLLGLVFLIPVLVLLGVLKALSLTELGFAAGFPIAFCLGAVMVACISLAGRTGGQDRASGSIFQTLLFLFTVLSYFLRSALLTIPVSATLLIDEVVDNDRSTSLIGATLLALGFLLQLVATF